MTATLLDDHGVVTEPATLTMQRVLPGPIARAWSYLADADLRRQWLAGGTDAAAGQPFELVWRNDELTDPPGARPERFGTEHRMMTTIERADPPHFLSFVWPDTGHVAFTLEEQGDDVLLTLVHSRIPNASTRLGVSSGWHAHLDVLVAKLRGARPEPFWDNFARLRADYEKRLGA